MGVKGSPLAARSWNGTSVRRVDARTVREVMLICLIIGMVHLSDESDDDVRRVGISLCLTRPGDTVFFGACGIFLRKPWKT